MSLGRRFGQSRTVYDSHRRYLDMNDPLRNRRQAHNQGYEYVTDERRQLGDFRLYETYQKNGVKAIGLNKAEYKRRLKKGDSTEFPRIDVEGVYGLWCLDILPYATHINWTIDFMHTCNNVCHDMMNSIRPSHSGVTGLFYTHKNRTYDEKVVDACRDEKIFSVLYSDLKPDWVLEVTECIEMDRAMNNVMGQFKSEELVKNFMRAGKAEKSHDTIYWCIVYARFYFV